MANIKSAKKRILRNKKKQEQNKIIKSKIKTQIKKLKILVQDNSDEAEAFLSTVFASIDSAESKNIFHKNTANRKKAACAKLVSNTKKAK